MLASKLTICLAQSHFIFYFEFCRGFCFSASEKLLRPDFVVEIKEKIMASTDTLDPNAFEAKEQRKIVNIGLIQTVVSDDIADNMEKTMEKIREAARRGAQIVCLQELYRTKYFPQEENQDVKKLAETIPGESTKALSALAEEKKIVIIAPLFERGSNGKYYNSAVTIDADGKNLGYLPQSAHTKRPLLLREKLF